MLCTIVHYEQLVTVTGYLLFLVGLYWFRSLAEHTVSNQSIITFKLLPFFSSRDDTTETMKVLCLQLLKVMLGYFSPGGAILHHLINLYKKIIYNWRK